MATVTYNWGSVGNRFLMNNINVEGSQLDPAVAALPNGGFFGAWSGPSDEYLSGRSIGADGTPVGSEFQINSTMLNKQFDSSVAAFADDRAIVTFTDTSGTGSRPSGDIRARLIGADGVPIGPDFSIALGSNQSRESDVATLTDGGYVVTFTTDWGSDRDVIGRVFNADGSVRNHIFGVSYADTRINSDHASVAALAGGGFVVAWQEALVAGANDTEVRFLRFDAAGNRLDAGPVLIDTVGSINQDIQVTALKDGGFAVAYTDNGLPTGNGTEISLRLYNADGSPRTAIITANDGLLAGNQDRPSIATLSNGFIDVSWSSGESLIHQIFDASGNALPVNQFLTGSTIEGEIAGLAGGRLAAVRSSTRSDGDGTSIQASILELTRATTGDGTAETLAGDGLTDLIFAGGGDDQLSGADGNDVLYGDDGNDVLYGGAGADEMHGGLGNDTYYVDDAGDRVIENAGEGSDAVVSFLASFTLGAEVDTLWLSGAAVAGVGNGANNMLAGNGLGNLLIGGGGRDQLYGLDGNDQLYGGDDGDYVEGNAGSDYVEAGLGDDIVNGGTGDDTISGGDGYDQIYGAEGNDAIYAGQGIDLVYGGDGNDVIYDEGGSYNVILADAGSGADGKDFYVSLGSGQSDLYMGGGDDTAYGGSSLDILRGQDGNDALHGQGGDDYLVGGLGADVMTGGSGADKFVIDALAEVGDFITDFGAGDQLWLSSWAFGISDAGRGSAFSTTAFAASGPSFLFIDGSGQLYHDPDGSSGATAASLVVTVASDVHLTANDLFMI
jgi:Ca2+-binding RTX toxin-like protein